jgi:uncharacterized protein YkwD
MKPRILERYVVIAGTTALLIGAGAAAALPASASDSTTDSDIAEIVNQARQTARMASALSEDPADPTMHSRIAELVNQARQIARMANALPDSDAKPPEENHAPPGTGMPPAPPPPPPSPANPSAESRVIELVNQARQGAGCAPVAVDGRLTTAASRHSADMAARNYFSHTTPEGVTFAERIKRAGYPSPGAENIAHGQDTAEQVMQGWMGSPGHRANIQNCSLRTIGVGTQAKYWTQDFGR